MSLFKLRVYRLVQQIVHDITGLGEGSPDRFFAHAYHLGFSMRGSSEETLVIIDVPILF